MTAGSCWSPGRPGSASRRWSRPSSRPCVRRSPTPGGCGVGATASSRRDRWAPSSRSPSSSAARRGRPCVGTRPDRSSSPRSGRGCARPGRDRRGARGPALGRRGDARRAALPGAAAARHAACSIVATYRDDALGVADPVRVALGDLAAQSSTRRVDVPPLSREAVATLVEGTDLEPAELHRLTGGNPFFVTEVLRVRVGGRAAVGPRRRARAGGRPEQLGAERPRRRGARGVAGRAGAAQRRCRRHGGGSRRAAWTPGSSSATARDFASATTSPAVRSTGPSRRTAAPPRTVRSSTSCVRPRQHGRRAAGATTRRTAAPTTWPFTTPAARGRRGRQGRPSGGGRPVRPGGSLLRRARCARPGRAARHARPGAELRGRLGGVGAGSTAGAWSCGVVSATGSAKVTTCAACAR